MRLRRRWSSRRTTARLLQVHFKATMLPFLETRATHNSALLQQLGHPILVIRNKISRLQYPVPRRSRATGSLSRGTRPKRPDRTVQPQSLTAFTKGSYPKLCLKTVSIESRLVLQRCLTILQVSGVKSHVNPSSSTLLTQRRPSARRTPRTRQFQLST